jgi:hypothetical protein
MLSALEVILLNQVLAQDFWSAKSTCQEIGLNIESTVSMAYFTNYIQRASIEVKICFDSLLLPSSPPPKHGH